MANTYYDSQLTAAEIEAVLEAIKGILTPANNGKVLAISSGKLEARSVQWGGGGGAVVQPLSVTHNGTYNPPSGVDGYAPVVVNVSGGGGIIDYSYLPNSIQADVLASADYTLFDGETVGTLQLMVAGDNITSSQDGLVIPLKSCLGYNLGAVDDVTVYFCGKKSSSGQFIIATVNEAYATGSSPGLWSPSGNSNMSLNVYNSSATLGVSSVDFNVYAFSINLTSKKIRGYANGAFITEISFTSCGKYVSFGNTPFESGGLTGSAIFKYGGVVDGVESDATIIANMQTIMQKLGIT